MPEFSDTFESPTFGFKLTIPESWHWIGIDEYLRHLNTVFSADEYFLKHATAPLVSATKFPEPHPDLNPSIKVQVKPNRSGPVDAKQLSGVLAALIRQISEDCEYVGPADVVLGDTPAAHSILTYTMNTNDGQSFPVHTESWVVPRESHYFLIATSRRQDAAEQVVHELEFVVRSIQFEKTP